MLKNYFKTAWRSLFRNKISSLINIGGLSVGMAVFMLIGLWIWDELSFNKYHQHYDRIAQVMQQRTYSGSVHTSEAVPFPIDAAIRKNYGSDFKHIAMSSWTWNHILTVGDKKISFPGNFMDTEAPEMFSLRMLKGDRNGLNDPSSILISASVAKALFGDKDPMGEMIQLDTKASFKVSGVYEDLPENTDLHEVAFLAPWKYYINNEAWIRETATQWGNNSFQMYVQLANHADVSKVSAKIRDIKLKNVSVEDALYKPVIFLHPMSKWHLHNEFKDGVNTGGAIEYVWLFGVIAIFVLLLACINFMNLSTARSEKRAREVGVRKAIGSKRKQLIGQFYCESVLMAFIAFIFSIVLVRIALPFFNAVAGKELIVRWSNPLFWTVNIGFVLLTGFMAGSYPALYLSSFNPIKVLKGTFKAGPAATIPRKVLVVVQFTISVILIIGTIIVFKQIQFAKERPLGYSSNGLVYIPMATDDLDNHFAAVKEDLLKTRLIAAVAQSSSSVARIQHTRGDIEWSGKDPSFVADFNNMEVTIEYGKTVGWQFIDGRDFSPQMLTDSSAVILNEAAVKLMGLKDPVGETIQMNERNMRIIGVIKDMVMNSPYEPAKQTVFYIGKKQFDFINMRILPNANVQEALNKIEAIHKKYAPSVPFTYRFADEEYEKKFANEKRIGKLAGFFAALAIFISCLGLFGMASFMAEQRTKEIGVRKVLGASVFNVWKLLSRDFVVLVMIALIIAMPVAWLFMNNWLQHYSYRSNIPWWIFAVSGAGALLITLATISFQSIKAALKNPVNALKSE